MPTEETITLEALKKRAEGLAQKTGADPKAVTLRLIHSYGVDRVDFSGGVRAEPDESKKPDFSATRPFARTMPMHT